MSQLVRPDGVPVNALSAHSAAARPQPERFGTQAWVTEQRIERAAALIATPGTPNAAAYAAMASSHDFSDTPEGPVDPWEVPSYYTDRPGWEAAVYPLRNDGLRAIDFALRYALTGDEAAATAAAAQIEPWTTVATFSTSGGNTRLSWSNTFPLLVNAAMLIRDSAAWTPELDAALVDVATRSISACSTIYPYENNWSDWGVAFELSVAALRNDPARFDAAIYRWKRLMEISVDSYHDLVHEIYRQGGGEGDGSSGLTYCNFAMAAKVYAAEIARVNGVWLYDYVSPSGHTLRGVWERVSDWTNDPASYPYGTPLAEDGGPYTPNNIGYYEVLHQLWPRPSSTAVLAAQRPLFDRYVVGYLTVTHAGLRVAG